VIVRGLLTRLAVTLAVWVLLIVGCFLFSYLFPSSLAYVGLALLYGWYVCIPMLLIFVSIGWLITQRIRNMQKRSHILP
jgi:hypothetical protein